MISTDIATRFEHDGYVNMENFFAAELMQRLDRRMERHFRDNPDFVHNDEFLDTSKTDVVPWFPQDEELPDFDVVGRDPRVEKLTGAVLGNGWNRHSCMVMYSRPGSKGQAWHQDCPPEDLTGFSLNRLVYTRSVTAATGGEVVVVPGSHRRGLLPAGAPTGDLDGQVLLRPATGSLLLIHGHAWHRVLPIGGSSRYSINYRAAPRGVPRDITDVCVYRNMRYRFSTSELIEHRSSGPR